MTWVHNLHHAHFKCSHCCRLHFIILFFPFFSSLLRFNRLLSRWVVLSIYVFSFCFVFGIWSMRKMVIEFKRRTTLKADQILWGRDTSFVQCKHLYLLHKRHKNAPNLIKVSFIVYVCVQWSRAEHHWWWRLCYWLLRNLSIQHKRKKKKKSVIIFFERKNGKKIFTMNCLATAADAVREEFNLL